MQRGRCSKTELCRRRLTGKSANRSLFQLDRLMLFPGRVHRWRRVWHQRSFVTCRFPPPGSPHLATAPTMLRNHGDPLSAPGWRRVTSSRARQVLAFRACFVRTNLRTLCNLLAIFALTVVCIAIFKNDGRKIKRCYQEQFLHPTIAAELKLNPVKTTQNDQRSLVQERRNLLLVGRYLYGCQR